MNMLRQRIEDNVLKYYFILRAPEIIRHQIYSGQNFAKRTR